jgi:glycosyltransferase involved in cell wall biosynthesis
MKETDTKKRILWFSDYGKDIRTGYATVSRNLIQQLKAYFGKNLLIEVVAINYYDEAYSEYDGSVTVTSAICGPGGKNQPDNMPQGEDSYGLIRFLQAYCSGIYDGVFILLDIAVVATIIPLMQQPHGKTNKEGKRFKIPASVVYFPVDGPIQTKVENKTWDQTTYDRMDEETRKGCTKWIEPLQALTFFDHAYTFTEYGQRQVMHQATPLQRQKFLYSLGFIYHGTNTSDFYALPENEAQRFRLQYFKKNSKKFIIGVINRNQPRKDIPTAIAGFIEASKQWPENLPKPFLYLHMPPYDPLGYDLTVVLQQTELQEGIDYMFSTGDHHGQVPVETLNKIYNSIDVYLSTATGGGWELTVTEAMACKVPCIIPAHTSLKELGGEGNRAVMLEEFLPHVEPLESVWRLKCHYEEVAEKIIEVAKNRHNNTIEWLTNMASNWVKSLTWESICRERWIEVFEDAYKLQKPEA